MTRDASAACGDLSSQGQQQAVDIVNKIENDILSKCEEALGPNFAGVGANSFSADQSFWDATNKTVSATRTSGNVSVSISGSTATVTIDGAEKLFESMTLKQFGDDWKIESFVAPDAL